MILQTKDINTTETRGYYKVSINRKSLPSYIADQALLHQYVHPSQTIHRTFPSDQK